MKRETMRRIMVLAGLMMALTAMGATAAPEDESGVDHYRAVLKTYVDGEGLVNYRGLKADRADLDRFTRGLAGLSPEVYDGLAEPAKIAFWLNAYNALTLTAIIDHYPIQSSFTRSLLWPDNSIRQIPGVWDTLTWKVMGRPMTLDQIEHEVLRKDFNEPRIHLALVCAARGCPPLRNEPYTGVDLDRQLNDQAEKFLRDPLKFRIDRSGGTVHLSSIFKWFGSDFVKSYGTPKFGDHSEAERAVLNFISPYLAPADRAYLAGGDYDLEYLDYDWRLNEQESNP